MEIAQPQKEMKASLHMSAPVFTEEEKKGLALPKEEYLCVHTEKGKGSAPQFLSNKGAKRKRANEKKKGLDFHFCA